jgi:hypothetical protein
MESSREMSGGSAAASSPGHSNTLTLNELMILRRKLQILETRIAVLEERMSSGSNAASGSQAFGRDHSGRSLETLKRNVIRAVTVEFDQF